MSQDNIIQQHVYVEKHLANFKLLRYETIPNIQ